MRFNEIVKMDQPTLKAALISNLKKLGYEPIAEDGFIYAEGTHPVGLVAHMDTVHHDNCTIICTSENGKYVMSPQGIGGDDRCGIYMILESIKDVKCSVIFTEDEEYGLVGAKKFCKTNYQPKELNYLVEFDRKGSNDAVFYSCDNPEFEKFITQEKYGFTTASGSCSDISQIAPHFKVAAVNLSCGYYNAHTQHEYVNMEQMTHNIERAKNLICESTEKFEYIEKVYSASYYTSSYYGKSSDYYDYYFEDDERDEIYSIFLNVYGYNNRSERVRPLSKYLTYICGEKDSEENTFTLDGDNYVYYMDSDRNLYEYDYSLDVCIETGFVVKKAYYYDESNTFAPNFSSYNSEVMKVMSAEEADDFGFFMETYNYEDIEDLIAAKCDSDVINKSYDNEVQDKVFEAFSY